MADQGKWFKLWVSALSDSALEDLSIEQWFQWVRLGVYIKAHGTDGVLHLTPPSNALRNVLRLANYNAIIEAIKLLPGYKLEKTETVTIELRYDGEPYTVTSQNWHKYQVDSSVTRVKRYRAKKASSVTVQEEKRRDVEEKRKEETPKPPLPSALHPTSTTNGTARGGGLKPIGNPMPTLKVNGKPYVEPVISEDDMMTPEEMEAIKRRNMPQKGTVAAAHKGAVDVEVEESEAPETVAVSGGDDDVF